MKEHRIKPGSKVKLDALDTLPPEKSDEFKAEIKRRNEKLGLKLADLQNVLYAEHKHRLLVVLQGLDTSGKDSTTRHVFGPLNPQGLRVHSFKAPTAPELDHDYLWRVHAQVPTKGEIAIFNRSHYEDLPVVRVHELEPKEVWSRRYRHVVEFERLLAEEGTLILKFFLHISKDEQKRRLQDRLDIDRKHWKWDSGDLRDRAHWDEYTQAYEDVLERTSAEEAPWYVVPADKKWWRDYVINETVVAALEALAMQYPKPAPDLDKIHID